MFEHIIERITALEQFNAKRFNQQTWQNYAQSEAFYGLHLALCVSTEDPLSWGRVRFYSPALHSPDTPVNALPWAKPISSFGGFDDSGSFFVPPAGSTVVIFFENGDRQSPFYIGTTWSRTRGEPPAYNFNFPVPEYSCFYDGHREGYLVGADDGSQVLPPWNTWAYNIPDFYDETQFYADPNAKNRITIPYVQGIKTPQKHRLKFSEGQYDCNYRWKHLELASGSGGGWLIMKDDHLHPAGQWAHPSCCEGGGEDLSACSSPPTGNQECPTPNENTTCEGNQNPAQCGNPYFKRQEECRPFSGPGTPQNNTCNLPQSGVGIGSMSGHVFLMDDSVTQPQGVPEWERAIEPFDFGCENQFSGKMTLTSATGNQIVLDDTEDTPELRGTNSGIRARTGAGHNFSMIDHTIDGDLAGEKRAIVLESTSTHLLEMNDGGNEQASSPRKGDGQPVANATSAFVVLRSGYGLQLLMRDDSSQQETQQQFIELQAPMKDNPDYGPHLLRMQETAEGPGIVYLRAGGLFLGQSIDDWIEVVGTDQNSPKIKLTEVKGHYLIDTEDLYYNHNDIALHFSERFTILAAERNCKDKDGNPSPCIYPIFLGKSLIQCPFTGYVHPTLDSLSQYVFASSSNT